MRGGELPKRKEGHVREGVHGLERLLSCMLLLCSTRDALTFSTEVGR